MGCNCQKTLHFLAKIGAHHAARMHKVGFAEQWKARDWLIHFDEEERLLFPIMRKKGLALLVDRLLEQHEMFRAEIRKRGEIVSLDALKQHARIEDEAIDAIAA